MTVCVLIVFVLGLVLYPVVTGSRQSHTSRRATCASNQKQIALGFLQYIQDYDECFPPAVQYVDLRSLPGKPLSPPYVVRQNWGPDRGLTDGRILPGLLSPYVKSNQLFIDPDLPVPNRNTFRPNRGFNPFVLHYMYNDLLPGIIQSAIRAATRTVLTTDAEDRFENAGHALSIDSNPVGAKFNRKGGCDAGKGASVGAARNRHMNGANFSFTDGHVKWYKADADDPVFFPPRESASISAVDGKTKQRIGPQPGGEMTFGGRKYEATFHVK